MIDLGAVAREAAARWRQDRALLLPLAGLLIFVPQWALLLLVPPLRLAVPATPDPAALAASAAVLRDWLGRYGAAYLGAALAAQWAQLSVVALYVARDGAARPTVGGALLRAGRLLPRYLLAELLVGLPLGLVVLAGAAAPLAAALLTPALFYVAGRTLLVGAALVARRRTGAAAAVALAWRWSRGHGLALGLLVALLLVGVAILAALCSQAAAALGAAHLSSRVAEAGLQGLAAALVAGGMLALAMSAAVLHRRLAG